MGLDFKRQGLSLEGWGQRHINGSNGKQGKLNCNTKEIFRDVSSCIVLVSL
jgi:hypothetical protein